MPERLLTTGEVAEYCQVTRAAVSQWIQKGELSTLTTPGGHHRIKLSEFRRFLQKHELPVDPAFFSAGKHRILLVDDNLQIIDFIASALQEHEMGRQCEIDTALDGFEAGIKVRDFTPDLIILDLMMPKVDGFSLCRQVKGHPETEYIKILVVTGFASEINIQRVLQAGADDYLAKPLDADELQERVGALLGWETASTS